MQKLEINKEDAVKAYENSTEKEKRLLEDLFGKKTFQLEVTERIKTVDDLLEENDLTRDEFDESCEGLEIDEIAYRLIKMLVIALNEGWVPDWTDSSEYKYVPYFNMNDSSSASRFSYRGYVGWIALTYVGSRLCFKSAKLAKYAGQQFIDVYRDYIVIK